MPAEVGIELDYDTASRVAESLVGKRRDPRVPVEAKRTDPVESSETGFWTKPLLEFARPALERGTRVAAALTPDSFAGSRAIDFNLGLANALGDEVIHFSSPMGGGLLAGMVGLGLATGPSAKAIEAMAKGGKAAAKIGNLKRIGKAAQGLLESGFSFEMASGLFQDFPELIDAAKKAKETGDFFDYGRAFGKVALDAYFGLSLGKAALKSGRAAKTGLVAVPKATASAAAASKEKPPAEVPLGEAMRNYTEDQFKWEGQQNGLSRSQYETIRKQGPETLARNVVALRERTADLADLRQRRARINEDAASLKEALAGARKARAGIDARKDLSGTKADTIEAQIAKIKSRIDALPQQAQAIDTKIKELGNPEGLLKATEASLIEYHRAVTEGIRLESPWRPPSAGTGRPGEPLPVKQWDTVDTWAGRGVVEEVAAGEGGVPQLRVRVKGGAGTGVPGEAPRDTILDIAGNDQSLSIVSSGGSPLSFTGRAEAPVPANRLLGAPPPGAGRGLPAASGEAPSAGVNVFPPAETATTLAGGGTLLRGSLPVTPETVTAVGRWALDNPRFTPGQLSEAFGFDAATTRRVIGRMEADGLILGEGGATITTSGEIMTAAEAARWNNLGFQAKARLRDLIAARSEGGGAAYEISGSVGRPDFGRSTESVIPPQPTILSSTQPSTPAPAQQPTRAASVSAPAVVAAMRRPAPGGVGAVSSTASPPAPPAAATQPVSRPLTPGPVAAAETSGARRPVELPPRVVQPTASVAVGAPPPGVPQQPAAAPAATVQLPPRVVRPASVAETSRPVPGAPEVQAPIAVEAPMPAAKKPGAATREFASTQINLPKPLANAVLEVGKRIAKSDLAEKGLETEPHVTVKYGIHSDNPVSVRGIVSGEVPMEGRLGRLGVFETPEADVLYAEVQSRGDGLARLNRKLTAGVENTETYPEYKPHVTIAYLKKGAGKKYLLEVDADGVATGKPWPLQGAQFSSDSVVFSPSSGKPTRIKLKGAEPTPAPPAETPPPPGVEARAPKSEMPIEPGPGIPEIGFPEGVRLMVKDDATAGLLRRDVVTYLGESEPGVQRFQTESGTLIERIMPREQVSAAFDVAPVGAKAIPRQGPEAPRKASGKRIETQAEANKRLREEVVIDIPVDESPYTDYARSGRDAIPEPEPRLSSHIPTWHAVGTRFRGKDGTVWRVTANSAAGVVSGESTARGRTAPQGIGPFSVIRLESVPSNRPDLLAKYAPYSSRETLGNAYFDRVSGRASRQLEGDTESATFREMERQEAARKKRLAKFIGGEGGGRPMGSGTSGQSAAPIPEGMGVEVIVGGKPEVWRKVVSKSKPAPPDVRGIYLREATAKSRAKGLNEVRPLTAAEKTLGAKPYRPVKLANGLWVVVNDSPIVREAPRLKQINIMERRRFDPANPELDYRNIESMSPGEFAERQSPSKTEVPKSATALGTPGHRALSEAAAWAQGRGGIPARVRVVGEISKEHPDGTLAKFTIEDTSKTTWAKENQQADQLLKLLPNAKWLEVESGTWRTRIAIKPFAEALKSKKAGADAGRPVKETKGSLGRGSQAMIEQVRATEERQRAALRGAPPPGVKPPPAAAGAPPPGVTLPPRVVKRK